MIHAEHAIESATMPKRIHPWERAGLGKAPFVWVGLTHEVGPRLVSAKGGVETWVGAPGQPMGSCAYCGHAIAECHHIRSADGKTFIVGCDCVQRISHKGDPVLTATEKASRERRNKIARERRARKDEAMRLELDALFANAALTAHLSNQPHPYAWRAEKGENRLDHYHWLRHQCGAAGRARLAKELRGLLAEVTL